MMAVKVPVRRAYIKLETIVFVCVCVKYDDYNMIIIELSRHLLRGAEEACWAHNPKVDGSKPSGAIFYIRFPFVVSICLILSRHFMEDIYRIKGIINHQVSY